MKNHSRTITELASLALSVQTDLTEEQALHRAYCAVVVLMGDLTPTEIRVSNHVQRMAEIDRALQEVTV